MNVAVPSPAVAAQAQQPQTPVAPVPAPVPTGPIVVAGPAPAAAPAPANQSAPATPPEKPPYPPAAPQPTQEGPNGIRFDFNFGCRAVLPKGEHPWRVRLSDLDTGNILFETTFEQGSFSSTKRYYIRFKIDVWQQDKLILSHEYDAKGREVCIQFPVGTLGDTMGWFPYAVKFQRLHGCKLTCAMAEKLIPLFQKVYPEITFVPHEGVKPETYYATYNIGLFFDDKDFVFQPCDFRYVGLHRTAGYILGVDPTEEPPELAYEDNTRPIKEPYVVIATQSTTQSKYWNNPEGWRAIIQFIKDAGYRVICIDQKAVHGTGLTFNHLPNGAEDETGDRPIQERARWLHHAEFFVGLSSGLSWLAWAARPPIVMIAGFTHPLNEFETPYRVVNYHTCNSCWNDPHHRFDHKDFLYCPRHKGTPRQFECTRLITVDHVKQVIRKVPGFAAREKAAADAKAAEAKAKAKS